MLLLYELKKIWKPWLILVTGVIFYCYYVINIRYTVGHSNTEIGNTYFKGIAARYGTHLEADEVDEMRKDLELLSAEQDAYVAAYPPCAREGITSFDEAIDAVFSYTEQERLLSTEEWNRLLYELASAEGNGVSHRYATVKETIDQYDYFTGNCTDSDSYKEAILKSGYIWDEKQVEDAAWIAKNFYGEKNNYAIMDSSIARADTYVFSHLLKLDAAAILILLLPVLLRDKRSRVLQIQCASRTGRNIWRKQLAAVLVSTGIITAGCLVLAFLVIAKMGHMVFWNTPVEGNWYNILNILNAFPLFNCTFGTFCLLQCIPFTVFSFSCALLVFVVSKWCRSIFLLMTCGIIAFYGLSTLASRTQSGAWMTVYGDLLFKRNPYTLDRIEYPPKAAAVLAFALLSSVLVFVMMKRVRKEAI